MFRIDTPNALSTLPTPGAAGTPGYFNGVAPFTTVTNDWLNGVQEEIMSVLAAAGITENKTTFNQLLTAIQSLGRIKLQANLSLYVATTGNDTTGNGSSGAPWATLQKAWNSVAQSYDLNGYTITINIGAGTFAGVTCSGQSIGSGNVVFQGAGSSTIISSSYCFAVYAASIIIADLAMTATGSASVYSPSGSCINIADAGFVTLGTGVIFGSATGYHISINVGALSSQGNAYLVTGGAVAHAQAGPAALINLVDSAVTLTGTPAFSSAFAVSEPAGTIWVYGMSYSGSATGQRFYVQPGGAISSNGAGPNFLPGNSAGVNNGYYS